MTLSSEMLPSAARRGVAVISFRPQKYFSPILSPPNAFIFRGTLTEVDRLTIVQKSLTDTNDMGKT